MRVFQGRVLLVSAGRVFIGKGCRIAVSSDAGGSFTQFSRIPVPWYRRWIYQFDLLVRLLRLGFHHMGPAEDGGFYVLFDRSFYHISPVGKLRDMHISPFGGRPLCVAYSSEGLLYGEYSSNPERQPVRFCMVTVAGEHRVLAEIPGVRHIHGVFSDPFSDGVWITTGDYGEEAGIWRWQDGKVCKIIGGGQQRRAVQLLFDESYVYFGTDTPLEENFIYRFKRSLECEPERLASVRSSIFYGCSVLGRKYLASVVEPSKINRTQFAEVWASDDGRDWSCVYRSRKDIWSMKYFQYGQFIFPCYSGSHEYLWFYQMSVLGGGKSVRMSIRKQKICD